MTTKTGINVPGINFLANTEEALKDFDNFVVSNEVAAPHTDIGNRAKINDSIKCVPPVERIVFDDILEMPGETSSVGTKVHQLSSGTESRVRFVGQNWAKVTDTNGTHIDSVSTNDYMEVMLYGTGLNILTILHTDSRNCAATVDTAAEGSSLLVPSNDILLGKKIEVNNKINAVRGLTPGWHRVKIRVTSPTLALYGIEILNESSNFKVTTGDAFAGLKKSTVSTVLESEFKAGVVGTKGARIIKYLVDSDISQAVQEAQTSPKFHLMTSHSDEELTHTHNFRSFGVAETSGFTTLTTINNVVHTLDDNMTTLVGKGVSASGDDYYQIATTHGMTAIGFFGTGLDLELHNNTGTEDRHEVLVDGTLRMTLENLTSKTVAICSGLPLQFHWVIFTRVEVVTAPILFKNFKVYTIKKPEVPHNGIKLTEYSLLADYVATNITDKDRPLSQGVIGLSPTREFNYSGVFSVSSGAVTPDAPFGWAFAATPTSSVEFWFYGTGIEIAAVGAPDGDSTTIVTLDDSTDFTSYTTHVRSEVPGCSFIAATGVWDNEATTGFDNHTVLAISNVPLGYHKISVRSGDPNFRFVGAYVICPIFYNDVNIGSLSSKDVVSYNPLGTLLEASKLAAIQAAKNEIVISGGQTPVEAGAPNFSFEEIQLNETITIPVRQQMAVHGGFVNNGTLNVDGTLVLKD